MSIFQGQTTNDIASRNSPQLLAAHCIDLERRYLAALEQQAKEVRELKALLSKTERIGIRVLNLQQQGRKTVRLTDLIEAT
jgi:hypothetical protein